VTRAHTGVYRGISAEDRRAERRRRLIDAAIDVIGTEGWSATTVRGVCQRAGLTPRFFYESFADLDTLAVAVFDEIVDAVTGRVLDAITAAPREPRAQAEAAIGTFVRAVTDDPRKARVIFIEALGNEALMKRRLATIRTMARIIAAQSRAAYAPLPVDDTFIDLSATVLAGGVTELLITWLQGDLRIAREQLIDDAVTLVVAAGESAAVVARQRAGRPG
jgi:AcrR family transcriptional regulator